MNSVTVTYPKSTSDRFISSSLSPDRLEIANWKLLNDPPALGLLSWKQRSIVERIAPACLKRSYDEIVNDPIVNRNRSFTEFSLRENVPLFRKEALKPPRKIPSRPEVILGAPGLADDYYLSVLDWSISNMISIGFPDKVYLWGRANKQITGPINFFGDEVTSVKFLGDGEQLVVGLKSGNIHLYQVTPNLAYIQTFLGHDQRVGTIDKIAETLFASGSRDATVRIFDRRIPLFVTQFNTHTYEACKVVTSPWDSNCLASGGKDGLLCLHDLRNPNPALSQQWSYVHGAAVKAIDFSPLSKRWLISGGGILDKSIRIFNLSTRKCFKEMPGNSQITNVFWSRSLFDSTVITTHGHFENCVKVWNQRLSGNLDFIQALPGSDRRILFAAPQPNGNEIAVAGNEELSFYKVFDSSKALRRQGLIEKKQKLGLGFLEKKIIR